MNFRTLSLVFVGFCIMACSPSDSRSDNSLVPSSPWVFEDYLDTIRGRSCPDGVAFRRSEPISIQATPIELGDAVDPEHHLPGASFVGGWHLTSSAENFGGLSGLAVFRSGNLLSVSDQGDLVWIAIEDDQPVSASISPLLGASGNVIGNKTQADAEGLALRDGIALVSFERNHRVAAFDLENCGSAARAVPLGDWNSGIVDMNAAIGSNRGAEALGLSANGDLLIGLETRDKGLPIAQLMKDGSAQLIVRFVGEDALALTGLDLVDDDLYAVSRDYRRGYGNDIAVQRLKLGSPTSTETLVRLDPSVSVDNFEAIAIDPREDGRHRIWLLSDNNFSDRQRTLLFAFDVTAP